MATQERIPSLAPCGSDLFILFLHIDCVVVMRNVQYVFILVFRLFTYIFFFEVFPAFVRLRPMFLRDICRRVCCKLRRIKRDFLHFIGNNNLDLFRTFFWIFFVKYKISCIARMKNGVRMFGFRQANNE